MLSNICTAFQILAIYNIAYDLCKLPKVEKLRYAYREGMINTFDIEINEEWLERLIWAEIQKKEDPEDFIRFLEEHEKCGNLK